MVLLSIAGGVALFIGIWIFVTSLLRVLAGMSRNLQVDMGRLLRESSWGSGFVNRVRARGCLRVAEYEKGWRVRMARLLGGGQLWLPKNRASISTTEAGGLFSPKSSTIVCGKDKVRLFGDLAGFVEQGLPAREA